MTMLAQSDFARNPLPAIRYEGERGLARADSYLHGYGYRLRTTDSDGVWLVGCHNGVNGAVWYPNWRAAYDTVRKAKQ